MNLRAKYVLFCVLGIAIGIGGTVAVVTTAVIPKFNKALDDDQKEISGWKQATENANTTINIMKIALNDAHSQTKIVTDEYGHTVTLDEWYKHSGGHVMNEAQCRAWMAIGPAH